MANRSRPKAPHGDNDGDQYGGYFPAKLPTVPIKGEGSASRGRYKNGTVSEVVTDSAAWEDGTGRGIV